MLFAPRFSPTVAASIAALALAFFVSLAPSASAASEPGLAFAQSGSLALKWDELSGGEEVAVCNGGGQEAQPLSTRLAGFGFKQTDDAGEATKLAPGQVLAVTAPEGGIAAGKCGVVSLALVDEKLELDAGEYAGSLVLLAPGLGVAQLALTVSGPGAVTKAAAVKGAVEGATLEAKRTWPWDQPHLVDGGELLLRLPASGEDPLTIGKGCRRDQNGRWTAKCPFIGNLYNGAEIIGVHVAGKVVEDEGVARLPVRISGADSVGDYEGLLDPSLTGEEEQLVKTKLSATDAIWGPIFALLIGAAIALLTQLWMGRWRPKHQLNRRKDSLAQSYVDAYLELNEREAQLGDGKKLTVELDRQAVEDYATEVKNAIFRYSWSTLLLNTESDAYKQIESSLTQAEEDRQVLAATGGLQKALTGLASEIVKAEALLLRNHLVQEVPELLAQARALLGERKVAVGDATARVKKSGELVASLMSWRKLAERVLGDEAWLFALAKFAKEGDGVSEGDRNALADLAVRLRAVHEELLRAEGDEDLNRLRVSRQVETAHGQITYLAGKYGVEKPSDRPVTLLAEDLLDPVERAFDDAYEVGKVEADDLPADAGEVISKPASAVQMPRRRFRVVAVDGLVLLFAAVAAIFTGLTAFYFGKSFGTWQDYATLILAGTAAQALAKVVLDNVSAFFHDITPLSDLEIAQAKIVPKSS